MSKRTILITLVVLACLVLAVAYLRQRNYNHFNGGEVTAIDTRGSYTLSEPAPVVAHTSKKSPAGHPMDEPEGAVPASPASGSDAPTDTHPPSPADGTSTSGSGRYQVYRQGDLTWRVDTESGSTCVLFATDEEWQNPRVYRRACERN